MLQHHQDPHHLPVVARVLWQALRQQGLHKIGSHHAALGQAVERVGGQDFEGGVSVGSHAKWQAEALLLLGDDLVRQKAADDYESLLPHPFHLIDPRDGPGSIDGISLIDVATDFSVCCHSP